MPIWEDIIPPEDLKMFSKCKMGGKAGYGKKPAIIIVDMTYGFVDDAFPKGCSKMGWPAVAAIQNLLVIGRSVGVPVFFSKGTHASTATERGRWKSENTFEQETFDPKEYQIVEELSPRPGEVVITKTFPSAFFGTSLASMLVYHHIDTVVVTGMVTSGCVRATVVDAFSYNFMVLVPEECVGDRGLVSHKVSLFDIHMKYADVLTLKETSGYLEGICATKA
jgi:nicotinamidase-related amidase